MKMIPILTCITFICFCVITYLWEKWKKRKKKLNREVHNALFQDNPMVPGPLVEDYRGHVFTREDYRREWGFDAYPYGHTEYCRCESCRATSRHYVRMHSLSWTEGIETDIPPTRQQILDLLQHRNSYANPTRHQILNIEQIQNRDYFIPLREKKQDFLPKKDIKSHKLVERKYAMRRPGIYTREVDYSNMYRRLRNENE